ncbi:transcriptional regulator CynR [Streptomyces sp. NPDC005813]|uniref:transcriptional regulator CynR n=1 Tax=Streptomyces sp. NPDC005813 TaxID=3155592 RepID=UPI0033C35E1A
MTLELRHLRYLLAVAEHGSFTRAADDLHVSQPTLSQQIKQLERSLGVQLLDRSGRTVRLTDVGEVYRRYARQAMRSLTAAQRAVHDVQDLSRGELRLAATPTFIGYFVGPMTAEFHTRHPGISLSLTEMTQDRMEAALLADDIDLGIAFEATHQQGIHATRIFTESLSLVVGPDHPQDRKPEALAVQDLAALQLALLSPDFATRSHIDAYFERHRVSPRIAIEANSIQALIEIVQRTTLATVLPDAVTDDHPQLDTVPLTPPLPQRTVVLLRRQGGYQSAASQAFADLTHHLVEARGYASPPPGTR